MRWTMDDIGWESFDGSKVDPTILAVVKAAALVERNSADYASYLCSVFPDDADFQEAARAWADEEIQHGEALGRWAGIADPGFDFRASFRRFTDGYRIPQPVAGSVRGSRCGELIARCVVETGTSSMYSALRDATDEPLLKSICHKIASDEFRHYKLFYGHLRHYLEQERPGLLRRLAVAFGRFREIEDDELSYAYYCANLAERRYDRRRAGNAYFSGAFGCYRPHHVERAVGMILKAVGLSPQGTLGRLTTRIAWRYLQRQVRAA